MVRIKIQSTSDLITNSSSEVFVVKTGQYTIPEIKELIQVVGEMCSNAFEENEDVNYKKSWKELEDAGMDSCSGMGGELVVYSWKEEYEGRCRWTSNYTIENFLEEEGINEDELDQYVWIDVDHSRRGTIKYILENLEVVNHDLC